VLTRHYAIISLTFVHARLVEQFRHFERFLFVRLNGFGDDHAQLVQQRIADHAERRVRRFVVVDNGLFDEIAARELIEIVARIDRLVHVSDNGGGCRKCGKTRRRFRSFSVRCHILNRATCAGST